MDRYGRVHLVGVGGAGMEGLARLLVQLGCRVSGTDLHPSPVLDGLAASGVAVRVGHDSAAIGDAELVVYSAAVPTGNVELVEAARRGVPVMGRAEFLGELTAFWRTAAVAGTHGKTTTASMLAAILQCAGLDPTVLIGGWVGGRSQARLGGGEVLVVEADEYAGSFLSLRPELAAVTNIDDDHLECYGDAGALRTAFAAFVAQVADGGTVVLNADDAGAASLAGSSRGKVVTWGKAGGAAYCAAGVELEALGASFDLEARGRRLGRVRLSIPGRHNVSNATAAAAAALELGVGGDAVLAALAAFRGVDRRFQVRGRRADGVLVVDDYAHHPSEVRAALAAARATGRRVVAAFQPHLYSRTARLCEEFAAALAAADCVLLAPVYGSRETPVAGVDSGLIARALAAAGYGAVETAGSLEELTARLEHTVQPGDLVITLGAGDINNVAAALAAAGGEA